MQLVKRKSKAKGMLIKRLRLHTQGFITANRGEACDAPGAVMSAKAKRFFHCRCRLLSKKNTPRLPEQTGRQETRYSVSIHAAILLSCVQSLPAEA